MRRPECPNWKSAIEAIDDDVYCWQCIDTLVLKIHGNPQESVITDVRPSQTIRTQDAQFANGIGDINAQSIVNQLKKEESFCSKCTIY